MCVHGSWGLSLSPIPVLFGFWLYFTETWGPWSAGLLMGVRQVGSEGKPGLSMLVTRTDCSLTVTPSFKALPGLGKGCWETYSDIWGFLAAPLWVGNEQLGKAPGVWRITTREKTFRISRKPHFQHQGPTTVVKDVLLACVCKAWRVNITKKVYLMILTFGRCD